MECGRCGHELPDDAFYCDECGLRVGAEYVGVETADIEDIPVLRLEEPDSTVDLPSGPVEPKLDRLVIAAIAIIGVAAAAAIIIVVGWVALPRFFEAALAG